MVIISVFSKIAVPEKTFVEVNRISCVINIVFEGGKNLFHKEIILKQVCQHSTFVKIIKLRVGD